MPKDNSIRIKISSEKKQLWQEYCDAHMCGLTLSRLIEQAVDDKVCAKTELKNKQAGSGWYWAIKPTGNSRTKYDEEVFSLARKEIERKKRVNANRILELGDELNG